jgi:hypothetical protein
MVAVMEDRWELQHVSYQELMVMRDGESSEVIQQQQSMFGDDQGRAKYGIRSSLVRSQQLVMKWGEMEMDWPMERPMENGDDDSSKSMLLKKAGEMGMDSIRRARRGME